jgi:quinate dehydrogenase (quinone)
LLQPTLAGATPVANVAANTECPRRVYTNTPDGRLIAVNADTGERCKDFGVNGTVDLLQGLGMARKPLVLKSPLRQPLQGLF